MSLHSNLRKIKFRLGYNPKVEKCSKFRKYIPEPYDSVVLLYADFELAWAWRYSKAFINNKSEIGKIARRERDNIPGILSLCDKYNAPVTWATVGHLFLEECKKENGKPHPNIPRNKYFENEYWKYQAGEWFDDDPCGNFQDNPEWYCPDLIDKILKSKIKHEIGCHTFSHIDCRDEVCTSEVFEAEINECKRLAVEKKIELKSFVHPGHTIGNLTSLKKLGFDSYRTDYGNILGYPVKHKSGLWDIKGTMELTYRKYWTVEYNIKFYKTILDRAIKNNSLCVFWFHPSFDSVFLNNIFPEVLSYLCEKSDKILLTTAGEYTCMLNKNN
ncbi:MAG: polysaccharide deacetylase family protein [Ignavibacteriae bacterium]|nr:polysaccharide deacetylase family protein [Ignavibacteriota bacterium]